MGYSITTLCGSLRRGSVNAQLLKAAEAVAPNNWQFEHLTGLGDIPLYNQDTEDGEGFPAPVTDLANAIRKADGLIIATPEYNYGPPGVLKNAIDWLSRVKNQPFDGLPLSIMSASPSPMGGIRAHYPLRQVFVAMKADVTPRPEVAVASAYERFEDGKLVHEQTLDVLKEHLAAFESVLARHTKQASKSHP